MNADRVAARRDESMSVRHDGTPGQAPVVTPESGLPPPAAPPFARARACSGAARSGPARACPGAPRRAASRRRPTSIPSVPGFLRPSLATPLRPWRSAARATSRPNRRWRCPRRCRRGRRKPTRQCRRCHRFRCCRSQASRTRPPGCPLKSGSRASSSAFHRTTTLAVVNVIVSCSAVPDLDQDLRFFHLPQLEAQTGPAREMLGDRDVPARPRRLSNTVELVEGRPTCRTRMGRSFVCASGRRRRPRRR